MFSRALVAEPVFCAGAAIGERSLLAMSSYAVSTVMTSIGEGVPSRVMMVSRICVAFASSLSICASLTAPENFAPSYCAAAGALAAGDCDAGVVACLLENADWVTEKCRKLLAAAGLRRDRGRIAGRPVMKEHSWHTGVSGRSILDLIMAVVRCCRRQGLCQPDYRLVVADRRAVTKVVPPVKHGSAAVPTRTVTFPPWAGFSNLNDHEQLKASTLIQLYTRIAIFIFLLLEGCVLL